MGSVILRSNRHINNSTGESVIDMSDTPTLMLQGTKDGLLRVSRGSEAYWHSTENIGKAQ